MTFVVEFETDSDAFEEFPATETARILWDVASKIRNGMLEGAVIDLNGNHIGKWLFTNSAR